MADESPTTNRYTETAPESFVHSPEYRRLVYKWMRREGGHPAIKAWRLTKQYIEAVLS